MKHQHIIQRLCLSLLLIASSVGAWATDYGCAGYQIFRSRDAGKNKGLTTLTRTNVSVTFSSCKTSKGTGNNAIYQLAKGSTITVKAADGYAIRWIILRDTEGGKDYNNSEGIKRIAGVTTGYSYNFEKNAVSNSKVSGANQNNLNDDDNNIVVTQYDATAQSVVITSHNNSSWGQFKVRDIIVGYVKVCKAAFKQSSMSPIAYVTTTPTINLNGYDGTLTLTSDNTKVATVNKLTFKGVAFGSTTIRATFPATSSYAKGESSMKVSILRDKVKMTLKASRPDVIFSKGLSVNGQLKSISDYVDITTGSGLPFDMSYGFIGSSNNEASLKVTAGKITWGGTSGTATITAQQPQSSRYEAVSVSFAVTVARSDNAGTVLIKDANEWKAFASIVNDKGLTSLNAKLDADANLGTEITMVGTESRRYSGTFDGDGHSITMRWYGSGPIAPFRCVQNASIKNLTLNGRIYDETSQLGGLICTAYGKVTISKCATDLALEAPGNIGGLVFETKNGSTLTVTDCLIAGTFKCTKDADSWGLIVNANASTCTIGNCLYSGETVNNTSGANITGRTYLNCYYVNPCNVVGARQITDDQVASGEAAWRLQNGRSEIAWGMTVDTDRIPMPTADGTKRVYKVAFKQDGKELAAHYTNPGGTVELPTIPELAGENYNRLHTYQFTINDDFTDSTPITADRDVPITFIDLDSYLIASADDWRAFAQKVNSGKTTVNGRLVADITLSSSDPMVGNYRQHYAGTFDGNGHSITMDINVDGYKYFAPFEYIEGATIKNLHTKGQITAAYNRSSGLISWAEGTNFVSNCISEVNITSSPGANSYNPSGIVFTNYHGNMTISDCVVAGTFTASTNEGKKSMAGFCYDQNGEITLNNCLYIGTNNAYTDGWSKTFATNATLNNCYYLNPCGEAQGNQVTEKQLKSGEVTRLLQNGRTDQCYWAQVLGKMPSLYREADKEKANYVYYDNKNKRWACEDFLFDQNTELPIGLDFTVARMTCERSYPSSSVKRTICLPFDYPIEGFKAYTFAGNGGNTVYFKEVSGKVEAYHPYFIITDGLTKFEGKNIEVHTYNADALKTTVRDYSFIGTADVIDNATAAAANAYILQSDGVFHKVTTIKNAAYIPPYRAYITVPSSSSAKALSIAFDGETTNISSVETTDADSTVRYYDLQGRYIGTSLDGQPKGIYICNGKKVIKK